jgi:tripartite-type tricarboxylate transporter receptor subunit TctC
MTTEISKRTGTTARPGVMATALAAAGLALGLAAAPSALASDFYAGKTVSFAVGFSPGGGNDLNARLLARHIGRFIPGTPTVIVQNMPGAASSKPVMYLDSGAPRDGTVIATFGNGIILLSLLDPEKMKVDLSKVAWIGSITREDGVCFSWHAAGINNWQDLLNPKKRFNVGVSAPGSNVYNATAVLKNMFKTNAHIIMGYPGSSEKRIAIERGELDGDCGSWASTPQDWLRDNKIVPLVRFSSQSTPGMPAMPYIMDYVTNDKDRKILDFLLASGEVGRPYVTSLAVPADRQEILRAAFAATMKDPAFLAEAKKLDMPISPVLGAEATKIVSDIYGAPADIVSQAREIVK